MSTRKGRLAGYVPGTWSTKQALQARPCQLPARDRSADWGRRVKDLYPWDTKKMACAAPLTAVAIPRKCPYSLFLPESGVPGVVGTS